MATEQFNIHDEFHYQLLTMNNMFGAGHPLAVVWSTNDEQVGRRTGMVVIQLPSGMTAKRFSVEYTAEGYTLKFLGKTRHKESDYFWEVEA